MLSMIMHKFEGDSKARRCTTTMTKLKLATNVRITDRTEVDIFNYMHSVHMLVTELLQLKFSPELIEDYATVPVLAVLESTQNCNDVMNQLQRRAIGKAASVQNKWNWEALFFFPMALQQSMLNLWPRKMRKRSTTSLNLGAFTCQSLSDSHESRHLMCVRRSNG